jgi:hypothetical protein
LKSELSDIPGGPVTLTIGVLTLVAQTHDTRHITWEHVLDIPLGAPAQVPTPGP